MVLGGKTSTSGGRGRSPACAQKQGDAGGVGNLVLGVSASSGGRGSSLAEIENPTSPCPLAGRESESVGGSISGGLGRPEASKLSVAPSPLAGGEMGRPGLLTKGLVLGADPGLVLGKGGSAACAQKMLEEMEEAGGGAGARGPGAEDGMAGRSVPGARPWLESSSSHIAPSRCNPACATNHQDECLHRPWHRRTARWASRAQLCLVRWQDEFASQRCIAEFGNRLYERLPMQATCRLEHYTWQRAQELCASNCAHRMVLVLPLAGVRQRSLVAVHLSPKSRSQSPQLLWLQT